MDYSIVLASVVRIADTTCARPHQGSTALFGVSILNQTVRTWNAAATFHNRQLRDHAKMLRSTTGLRELSAHFPRDSMDMGVTKMVPPLQKRKTEFFQRTESTLRSKVEQASCQLTHHMYAKSLVWKLSQ